MTLIERGCGLDMGSIGDCGRWPSDQHGLFSELEVTSRDSASGRIGELANAESGFYQGHSRQQNGACDHGCSEVLRLQQTKRLKVVFRGLPRILPEVFLRHPSCFLPQLTTLFSCISQSLPSRCFSRSPTSPSLCFYLGFSRWGPYIASQISCHPNFGSLIFRSEIRIAVGWLAPPKPAF
jgi:hypothetical protein